MKGTTLILQNVVDRFYTFSFIRTCLKEWETYQGRWCMELRWLHYVVPDHYPASRFKYALALFSISFFGNLNMMMFIFATSSKPSDKEAACSVTCKKSETLKCMRDHMPNDSFLWRDKLFLAQRRSLWTTRVHGACTLILVWKCSEEAMPLSIYKVESDASKLGLILKSRLTMGCELSQIPEMASKGEDTSGGGRMVEQYRPSFRVAICDYFHTDSVAVK